MEQRDGAGERPSTDGQAASGPSQDRPEARVHNGQGPKISENLAARLRELGRRVPPADISDVWVFPPLPYLEGSAEFLLFTRFTTEGLDGKRRLCAAEFRSLPAGNGANGSAWSVRAGNGADGEGQVDPMRDLGDDGREASQMAGKITEYGAVPTSRVPGLVAGFQRRLGDDRDPVHLALGGCPHSWEQLVVPDDGSAD